MASSGWKKGNAALPREGLEGGIGCREDVGTATGIACFKRGRERFKEEVCEGLLALGTEGNLQCQQHQAKPLNHRLKTEA